MELVETKMLTWLAFFLTIYETHGTYGTCKIHGTYKTHGTYIIYRIYETQLN